MMNRNEGNNEGEGCKSVFGYNNYSWLYPSCKHRTATLHTPKPENLYENNKAPFSSHNSFPIRIIN